MTSLKIVYIKENALCFVFHDVADYFAGVII